MPIAPLKQGRAKVAAIQCFLGGVGHAVLSTGPTATARITT